MWHRSRERAEWTLPGGHGSLVCTDPVVCWPLGHPYSSSQAGSGRETRVWLVLAQTVTLSYSYSLSCQLDSLS